MIKTKVELLNEIANKLGDTNADEFITESQALQNILMAVRTIIRPRTWIKE